MQATAKIFWQTKETYMSLLFDIRVIKYLDSYFGILQKNEFC